METGHHPNGSAGKKASSNGNSNGNGKRKKPSPWNVGVVGLGKLGMPVALGMSLKGHNGMGYDIEPSRAQKDYFPHREIGPMVNHRSSRSWDKAAFRSVPFRKLCAHPPPFLSR